MQVRLCAGVSLQLSLSARPSPTRLSHDIDVAKCSSGLKSDRHHLVWIFRSDETAEWMFFFFSAWFIEATRVCMLMLRSTSTSLPSVFPLTDPVI